MEAGGGVWFSRDCVPIHQVLKEAAGCSRCGATIAAESLIDEDLCVVERLGEDDALRFGHRGGYKCHCGRQEPRQLLKPLALDLREALPKIR